MLKHVDIANFTAVCGTEMAAYSLCNVLHV